MFVSPVFFFLVEFGCTVHQGKGGLDVCIALLYGRKAKLATIMDCVLMLKLMKFEWCCGNIIKAWYVLRLVSSSFRYLKSTRRPHCRRDPLFWKKIAPHFGNQIIIKEFIKTLGVYNKYGGKVILGIE